MRQLKIDVLHLLYAVFSTRFILLTGCLVLSSLARQSSAAESEVIGLDALRRERPGITGAGVAAAQAEAQEATNAWQVNPLVNTSVVFRWIADGGTATSFPNSVGVSSSHAYGVAD